MIVGNTKLEKAKEWALASKFVQQRLMDIFSHFDPSASGIENENKQFSPFYTAPLSNSIGEGLMITYDNGLDPDPAFSNRVSSNLYLDQKHALRLTTYSSKTLFREEVLWKQVKALEFNFFDPSHPQEPSSFWAPKRKGAPVIVEMTLTFLSAKKKPLTFAFFVPAVQEPITYKKKSPL